MSKKLLQYYRSKMDVGGKVLPKFQVDGLIPIDINERSRGDIQSYPSVVKNIPLSSQQLLANKKAIEERTKAENAKILADRAARIQASINARKQPFSAQRLADKTQAIGDKFRLFPNDPNSFIDEYLNPGVLIGNMASGLGRVPLNIQQGNYGQAAWNVASPLATGALAGIGAKGTSQFVNNLVNPLAGVSPNSVKSIYKSIPKNTENFILFFDDSSKDFLKNKSDLKYLEEWGKRFGYSLPENSIDKIAQSNLLTDRTVRGLMNRHNSFARGVSTNWGEVTKVSPETIKHLQEQGIDYINNPKAAAEYMATHVPIKTNYGRSGLPEDVLYSNKDALYTSNSFNTAEGYTYGNGYVVKSKLPTDFSSINRRDWIAKNDPNYLSPYSGKSLDDLVKQTTDNGNFQIYKTEGLDLKLNKNINDYTKSNTQFFYKDNLNFPYVSGLFEQKKYMTDILPSIKKIAEDLSIKYNIPNLEKKLLKSHDNDPFDNKFNIIGQIKYTNLLNKLIKQENKYSKAFDSEIKKYLTNEYGLGWREKLNKIQYKEKDLKNPRYGHYLFIGSPGQKILDPIKTIKINPDNYINQSRSHIGEAHRQLSGLKYGGPLPKFQIDGLVPIDYSRRNVSESTNSGINNRVATQIAVQQQRAIQQRQAAIDAMREKQGYIKQGTNQSGLSKSLSIAAHPMTAASYLVKGQRIPDNFERASTNNYDIATSIINPASVIYSSSEIPKNIKEGNYTGAFFNTLGALPALEMVPGAVKAANPMLYNVNKQLIKNKDFKNLAAVNALSAVDVFGPMIMKTPGLKDLYKRAAYNIASTSGGAPNINAMEAIKTAFFPKLSNLGKYLGNEGFASPAINQERDLVKQYIYGNSPGFEKVDLKPYGLEKYIDRYGDMDVFKLNSVIPHGEPIQFANNSQFAQTFANAIRDSGGDAILRKRGNVTIPLVQGSNPIKPIDDISGHTIRISQTGVPDEFNLTTQDIWKFHPQDYLDRWGTGVGRETAEIKPNDYLTYLQAKLLERSGKPFVLMQQNPLKFSDNTSQNVLNVLSPPKGYLDNYADIDIKENPTIDIDELYQSLDKFELYTAPTKNKSFIRTNKLKQEGGPIDEYKLGLDILGDEQQFKDGGSLNRTVTCSNCGWSWKLVDGGKDPMTCHQCGGQIKMQEGGSLPEYQTKGQVKEKTIYVDDPNHFRLKAYQDSSRLYNKWNTKGWKEMLNIAPNVNMQDIYNIPYSSKGEYKDPKGRSIPIGSDYLFGSNWREIVKKTLKDKIKPLGYLYSDLAVPVYKKPVERVKYRKPVVAQPQIVPTQQPVAPVQPIPPAYRMQGTIPVYGPSNSLIGMLNQESGEFYPDYINTAGRARVNQADADIIGNQQNILEYLRMKGVNNPKVIPQKQVGGPIFSTEGFKQGPPPQGSYYRIPSNTLYNPTPYRIKAVANTGQVQYLNPFDDSNINFPGADYVDEYPMMKQGGSLPKYQQLGSVNILKVGFGKRCEIGSDADGNCIGGTGTVGYDDMQKQLWKERTNLYQDVSDREGKKARRAQYEQALAANPGLTPEMFAMADWDAWSLNSGFKNYGKNIDPVTRMIPDSITAPSQFKYFINNKIIKNPENRVTPQDMINYYNQMQGGFEGGYKPLFMQGYRQNKKYGGILSMKNGGQHGGLDRWFAEKWVDIKTGKACGRQEGESRAYPACRPSKRVSSQTPKTRSEMSSSEKAKFKQVKTSSNRIPYNHKKK